MCSLCYGWNDGMAGMMSWGHLKTGMREEWGHFQNPLTPIICTQHCRAGNIPGFQRNCGSHCRAGQGKFLVFMESWLHQWDFHRNIKISRQEELQSWGSIRCLCISPFPSWINQPFHLGLDGLVHTQWNNVFSLVTKIIFQHDPSKMGFFPLDFSILLSNWKISSSPRPITGSSVFLHGTADPWCSTHEYFLAASFVLRLKRCFDPPKNKSGADSSLPSPAAIPRGSSSRSSFPCLGIFKTS